jgi:hypothetical protein
MAQETTYDDHWHERIEETVSAHDVMLRGNGNGTPGVIPRVAKIESILSTSNWLLKAALGLLLALAVDRGADRFWPKQPQLVYVQNQQTNSQLPDGTKIQDNTQTRTVESGKSRP